MDGSSITIRHIQSNEGDAFAWKPLLSDPFFYASSYDDWASLSVDEWQQRLHDLVFVAFQDGEPVGVPGLLRQLASKMAHRATIVMVYVRKNLRGTGLVRNLLNIVADYARDTGVLQLEVAVSAENQAAIRSYLREGFSEVGRIPGGFLHNGKEIDDVMMIRRLRG